MYAAILQHIQPIVKQLLVHRYAAGAAASRVRTSLGVALWHQAVDKGRYVCVRSLTHNSLMELHLEARIVLQRLSRRWVLLQCRCNLLLSGLVRLALGLLPLGCLCGLSLSGLSLTAGLLSLDRRRLLLLWWYLTLLWWRVLFR